MFMWIFDVILSIFIEVFVSMAVLYTSRYIGSGNYRTLSNYPY